MIKISIFNKKKCFDCRRFRKCLSKKKQWNTSVRSPAAPDSPEVYASLSVERHRACQFSEH